MSRRITLLNQWRIWANGLIKVAYMGFISALVSGVGDLAGVLTRAEGLKAIGVSLAARILQYLLSHEPPDVFVTEESIAPDGTVTKRLTAISRPVGAPTLDTPEPQR